MHVLGWVVRRGSRRAAYRAAVGLFAGDLVLVLAMLWFFNRSPSHSHWALLAIPVLQAALLARPSGALAAFAVAAPVLVLRHDAPVSELGFQLAVLLLLSVVAGTQASLLHARISELAALHSELQHRATHDALTGLPARSVLMDRLDDALATARRDASMVAVLYVDCDRFKEVNDTLGHRVGDRVLVEAGLRLRRATRSWDTVARIGGDEFAVVLAAVRRRRRRSRRRASRDDLPRGVVRRRAPARRSSQRGRGVHRRLGTAGQAARRRRRPDVRREAQRGRRPDGGAVRRAAGVPLLLPDPRAEIALRPRTVRPVTAPPRRLPNLYVLEPPVPTTNSRRPPIGANRS
ncbi:MAG TPA: GGDEF domain-containing protein [Mycobacteriales bacterium]|nr:GGDEF domain-containing protein [Mycobacteriales bacterium]